MTTEEEQLLTLQSMKKLKTKLSYMTIIGKKRPASNQAQALVELAIFSSILLFTMGVFVQYGMRMNYEQNLQMQTTRETIDRSGELGNPDGVSYVTLAARSLPKADSAFGESGDPELFSASSSVTRTIDAEGLPTILDWYKGNMLPRIHYKIFDRDYELTTAAYKRVELDPNNYSIKKRGDYIAWKEVGWEAVDNGGSYDIDGDEEEELIIDGGGTYDAQNNRTPPQLWYGRIKFKCIDYQEGQINLGDLGRRQKQEYQNQEIKKLNRINEVREINGPLINTDVIEQKNEFTYSIQLNPKARDYSVTQPGDRLTAIYSGNRYFTFIDTGRINSEGYPEIVIDTNDWSLLTSTEIPLELTLYVNKTAESGAARQYVTPQGSGR